MKVISVVNNKGGVSKTSSAANIGAYLSYNQHKVLLVDSDPQANLTQHFNFYEINQSISNSYEEMAAHMKREIKLPLLEVNENLFIVPSAPELREVEKNLVTRQFKETFLKKLLAPLQDHFDYCIIDCPPSLGVLTDNAIFASDGVIIPIESSVFSLNGVKTIVSYFEQLKFSANLDFEIIGVFMAKFDVRNSISRAVKQEVEAFFGDKMFDTSVRINVAITDAQANGMDVFRYSRDCNSALDYARLSDEIVARLNLVTA